MFNNSKLSFGIWKCLLPGYWLLVTGLSAPPSPFVLRTSADNSAVTPISEQFRPQTFAATDLEWALRVLARVREA